MTDVLKKVPLDQETKAVLLGGTSYLRPLYQLMLAEVYWQAMQWARQMNGG
jgi:hypothetical protein